LPSCIAPRGLARYNKFGYRALARRCRARSNLGKWRTHHLKTDLFRRAAASPFIESKVLLPLIDLGKGLPQTWPRRRTATPLLPSVDVVHGVGKRWSTGVVEEGLTSSPGALHHPPRSLQESSNQRATLCRHVRGCLFPVEVARAMWSACCHPCSFSCVILPKSTGVHREGLSWSSSS
jgi:hypothetical protein